MTCREFIEFLLDYTEQRLSPEERECFDAHLDECPDCRTYLDTYGRTVDFAKLAGRESIPVEAPEDLIEAILKSRRK